MFLSARNLIFKHHDQDLDSEFEFLHSIEQIKFSKSLENILLAVVLSNQEIYILGLIPTGDFYQMT